MVLSFFRRGDNVLEHVEREIAAMFGHCRHGLDLAMSALTAEAGLTAIGAEVRRNDRRVNAVEEAVRRELVVHTAVHGGADVPIVLTSLLIVKKLERLGDQTKNIYDLAAEGFRFRNDDDDFDRFVSFRSSVSSLVGEAAEVLAEADEAAARDFVERCESLMDGFDALVNELIHSDAVARYAVPRAMLWRYLKRIVANASGVVGTLVTPLSERHAGPDLDD